MCIGDIKVKVKVRMYEWVKVKVKVRMYEWVKVKVRQSPIQKGLRPANLHSQASSSPEWTDTRPPWNLNHTHCSLQYCTVVLQYCTAHYSTVL